MPCPRIAIINLWFGNAYPALFPLWMKSAAYNRQVDFLLFGNVTPAIPTPPNFHYFPLSLAELETLARRQMDCPELIIPTPYKICDYKPMFGTVFREYLSQYDFWGHCDLDMLFGDLSAFLTPEKLAKYDKIYPNGHLSLYRNTPEVNSRWRLPYGKFALKNILTMPVNFAFDEWDGIYHIYRKCGFPFYREVEFAEPVANFPRFRLIPQRSNPKYERRPQDYREQLFYWEEGKICRAYCTGEETPAAEEFAYIHFQSWRFADISPEILAAKRLFFTRNGFQVKPAAGLPSRQTVNMLNPPCPPQLEELIFWWRKKQRRLQKMITGQSTFADKKLKVRTGRS